MKNFLCFSVLFFICTLTVSFCGIKSHSSSDKTAFHHMTMSHSFEGPIAIHLERIVKKFNAISPKVQVALKFISQMKAAHGQAFNVQSTSAQPVLLWVPSDKQTEMLEGKRKYISLNELIRVHARDFIPAVYNMGAIDQKFLVALPLGITTPVLFYNKKAFKEAGLNPHKPPATWEELEEALIKLEKAGYAGIAITDTPMRILKHFSALHNLPLVKGRENSLTEISKSLHKKAFRKFLKRLSEWQKAKTYIKGTDLDPHKQFIQGKVAILLTEAHYQEMLIEGINKQDNSFKVGVGPYPYSQSIVARPYAMDVQGQSLWILSGSETSRKEATLFIKYLMSPEVQGEWHENTTFLPLTKSVYKHMKQSKFYSTHPVHKTACHQVIDRPKASSQRKIYLSDCDTLRLEQALEEILQGKDLELAFEFLEK